MLQLKQNMYTGTNQRRYSLFSKALHNSSISKNQQTDERINC